MNNFIILPLFEGEIYRKNLTMESIMNFLLIHHQAKKIPGK